MALFTLDRMALGGMYDQIGGGFCRYSVDEQWMIPHFEKMLYDNGPLLSLYSEAWAVTREPLFKRVAEQTAAWVMRDMQSAEGGYYSSVDADSEGVEGKFFVWTPEQVDEALGLELDERLAHDDLAALYLREYAKQNAFTSAVRIAVNNLAGVPSIVFGVTLFLGAFSPRLPRLGFCYACLGTAAAIAQRLFAMTPRPTHRCIPSRPW